MRLWVETNSDEVGRAVRAKIKDMAADVNRQVISRATRAVNVMRNAELEVLRGQRSGKRYRKYPFRSYYTASAPGEPPARRSGNLRLHWNGTVETSPHGKGMEVKAVLESQEKYAVYLEEGTKKMAARPFHDRIAEKAKPEIEKIYSEPYR